MSYRDRQPDLHQEEDTLPRGKVLLAIAVVLVVSAVLVVWTASLVAARFRALRPSGAFVEQQLGPRRMVSRVREDLFDEQRRGPTPRERQKRDLETYGWVDEARGIVRIPIQQAIELTLTREGQPR